MYWVGLDGIGWDGSTDVAATASLSFSVAKIYQELNSIIDYQLNQYYSLISFLNYNMRIFIYDCLTKQKKIEFSIQEYF